MILSILDFSLFPDCKEYHSFFQPLEVTRHTLMSDKMGFHFFELPKLPEEISDKDELLLWLALFNANTEEELEQIKALEVPEMEQAINAYYKITASPEFRAKRLLFHNEGLSWPSAAATWYIVFENKPDRRSEHAAKRTDAAF